MPATSRSVPPQSAIPDWLDNWEFTRFVTLATNDSSLSGANYRQTLRRWDARMNHKLLGKHWAARHSDRMWAFYFLEKAETNPHWHGLIRFYTFQNKPLAEQHRIFDENAGKVWKRLVPSGSVNVQAVTVQRGAADYVAKMLGYQVSYESFVTPDEFTRG